MRQLCVLHKRASKPLYSLFGFINWVHPFRLNPLRSERVHIREIKRKCVKNKAQIIIIDYLQLISPDFKSDNSNKTYEIGEITRRLKIMAGELGALVILLSQLNRNVETRAISRPIFSDLRDSGAIEQDATGIVFLSKINPDDNNSDILVDVAKNRCGGMGQVIFRFNRATQTLYETEKNYISQKKKVRNYAD